MCRKKLVPPFDLHTAGDHTTNGDSGDSSSSKQSFLREVKIKGMHDTFHTYVVRAMRSMSPSLAGWLAGST